MIPCLSRPKLVVHLSAVSFPDDDQCAPIQASLSHRAAWILSLTESKRTRLPSPVKVNIYEMAIMTLLRNELSGLAFPSTSMNTVGMLRLCFPSAIGISLPNLELPIISLILSAYSLKASGDYAIALSTFMFANTFVCPLCAVVIKMKKSAETLMFSALLVGALLDIESILLKILGHQPQKKQLFGFLALLCLAAPILFVALCLILDRFDLLPAGSRTIYMNAEFFIAIVGVSMLWILRGYIRANLMNDNRLRIINASILVAMMTPLAVFYAVEIPNYGVMLSLSIFSALIILELLCYALYGMTQALQRRQIAAE